MDRNIALDTYLLRPYFKDLSFSNEMHSIKIDLISSPGNYGFTVRMEMKDPGYHGAYPQRKYALEQHIGRGHEGIHLQISYHLVSNYMNIGRLYIRLEVDSDQELMEISQGFVYTLYEILKTFGPEMRQVIDHIFEEDMLEELQDRKPLLIAKVQQSFTNRAIEIVDNEKGKRELFQPGDLQKLMQERKELIPLLGGIGSTK